jgi:uncharacterized protein
MVFSEYQLEAAGTLVRRVFGWMTLGLSITGITAFGFGMAPGIQKFLNTNPSLMFMLILVQLGLVVYLSFGLQKMSSQTAILSYLFYSFVTGITFSTLFALFTLPSLGVTFLICAATFGAMALYGLVTRSDLSGLGNYLFMGLIGLIISGVVNMFLKSSQVDFVTSFFGVIIFTLFTAYDVQMVKRFGLALYSSGADMTKVSIISALKLYLDFVNLFLYLLRFFGQRKD